MLSSLKYLKLKCFHVMFNLIPYDLIYRKLSQHFCGHLRHWKYISPSRGTHFVEKSTTSYLRSWHFDTIFNMSFPLISSSPLLVYSSACACKFFWTPFPREVPREKPSTASGPRRVWDWTRHTWASSNMHFKRSRDTVFVVLVLLDISVWTLWIMKLTIWQRNQVRRREKGKRVAVERELRRLVDVVLYPVYLDLSIHGQRLPQDHPLTMNGLTSKCQRALFDLFLLVRSFALSLFF